MKAMRLVGMSLAATATLTLGACASMGMGPGSGPGGTTTGTGGTPIVGTPNSLCNATKLDWAIGSTADAALLAKIKSQSGATTGRLIRPGTAVTRDYNPQRVNVNVNANSSVTSVTCG